MSVFCRTPKICTERSASAAGAEAEPTRGWRRWAPREQGGSCRRGAVAAGGEGGCRREVAAGVRGATGRERGLQRGKEGCREGGGVTRGEGNCRRGGLLQAGGLLRAGRGGLRAGRVGCKKGLQDQRRRLKAGEGCGQEGRGAAEWEREGCRQGEGAAGTGRGGGTAEAARAEGLQAPGRSLRSSPLLLTFQTSLLPFHPRRNCCRSQKHLAGHSGGSWLK